MGVERFNERVMQVYIVVGDVLCKLVSCYCPRTGRSVNKNKKFYEIIGKVVTSEKVLVSGDFNGHVGSDMGDFGEVHGGFGIGQINDGGIRLFNWAIGKGLRLVNTCFPKKRSWLITFRLGESETMIDYILVNSKYISSAKYVKVIPGEEIVSQHRLLFMDMVLKKKLRRKENSVRN